MKILRNFLLSLAKNQVFSQLFLFNPDSKHQENMEKVLKSDNIETRMLLAEALSRNIEEISRKMVFFKENDKDVFFEYMNVLFYQLADPEAEIGLKVLKLLINIADFSMKNKEPVFFLDKSLMKYLENGLFKGKDVVKVRFMDLIASISTKSPEFFEINRGFFYKL